MTPKEFYTADVNDPAALNWADARVVVWLGEDELGPRNLPEQNTVFFEGAEDMFRYARVRLSSDGSGIEIASLFGSLRVGAHGLDVSKPVGLMCLRDGKPVASSICQPTSDWGPLSPKALGRMKAIPLGDGRFEPISTVMATRGMDGVEQECLVVLPERPSKIKKVVTGVEIDSGGYVFVVSEKLAAKAVLAGKVSWVVPSADGIFIAA